MRERGARIRRVVQHARGVDDVERALAQPGRRRSVSMNCTRVDAEAARRGCPEEERSARQIGADHDAVGARQVQAHLAGAAADLDDARVAGDGLVEQPRELAALGAPAQRGEAVARRIAGEGRVLVEARAPRRCAGRGEPQVGDAVRRLVLASHSHGRTNRRSSAPAQLGQARQLESARPRIRRSSR